MISTILGCDKVLIVVRYGINRNVIGGVFAEEKADFVKLIEFAVEKISIFLRLGAPDMVR